MAQLPLFVSDEKTTIQRLRQQLEPSLGGAMALQKEQERICREMGKREGMSISLKNKAIILAKMGKKGEAHRLAEESLRLAKEHGYRSLAQQIKSIKDKL